MLRWPPLNAAYPPTPPSSLPQVTEQAVKFVYLAAGSGVGAFLLHMW